MENVAVVIFNLGGPKESKDIGNFLFSLFYDKYILQIPNPFRWLLAHFIALKRKKKAEAIYDKIGGGSPILAETIKQAQAITEIISRKNIEGKLFKVFVAMRHSAPFISDVIKEIMEGGFDKIILLPLYPQYSTTTTRSFVEEFVNQVTKNELDIPVNYLCCYPDADKFIDAHVDLIKENYTKAELLGNPKILFSAHSLPKKIVDSGDPYQWQVEYTVNKIVNKLSNKYGLENLDWIITYQSRVGYTEWLSPYTENEIIKASKQQLPLIIVPISFVSEHSETLVELDIIYQDIARQNGAIGYFRVNTLQASKLFIEYLAEICISLSDDHGRMSRLCPDKFSKCIFKKFYT